MDDRNRRMHARAQRAHGRFAKAKRLADAAGKRAQESRTGDNACVPAENTERLEAAGYCCNAIMQVWEHPLTKRALDAAIAVRLTRGQLTAWLADPAPSHC